MTLGPHRSRTILVILHTEEQFGYRHSDRFLYIICFAMDVVSGDVHCTIDTHKRIEEIWFFIGNSDSQSVNHRCQRPLLHVDYFIHIHIRSYLKTLCVNETGQPSAKTWQQFIRISTNMISNAQEKKEGTARP